MHLPSVRRLGLVGLTTVALALPTSAAVASTSGVDAPVPSPTTGKSSATFKATPDKVNASAFAADVSKLTFKNAITLSSSTKVTGGVKYSGPSATLKVQLRVNGVVKGWVPLYKTEGSTTSAAFYYPSKWGGGPVRVIQTAITSGGETIKDSTDSNAFNIRYGLNRSSYYTANRYGSKVTFKANRVTMYKKTKYVSVGRAVLQVKTSSGWKDKKVLKLASNGNSASYTIKISAKKYYRLKVATTAEREGVNFEVIHI